MRIIGGTLRGRRIQAPAGQDTRPMLDRVREAMFSTLGPWLVEEPRVLDLFAGSGSLGIEALSRGATEVRFVERLDSTAKLLRETLAEFGLEDRVQVLTGDALDPGAWGGEGWADIVFFDPPYPAVREIQSKSGIFSALHQLVRDVLAPEGVLVFHAPRGRVDPHEFEPDLVARERIYGTNSLWYTQRDEET